MGLSDIFNRDGKDKQTDEQTNDEPGDPIEELLNASVTVIKERELSFSYTEHEATAFFTDGTEKDYTFDGLKHKDGGIALYDYGDELAKNGMGRIVPRRKDIFTFLPNANLKELETTKRKSREMTKTVERKVDMPLDIALENGRSLTESSRTTIVEAAAAIDTTIEQLQEKVKE